MRWAEGKSGVYEEVGSGDGDACGGETAIGFAEGIRIKRVSGFGEVDALDRLLDEARRLPNPLITLRLEVLLRPRSSLLPMD